MTKSRSLVHSIIFGISSFGLLFCCSHNVMAYGDENVQNEKLDSEFEFYNFKDNKTTGTITVTKEWNDNITNNERDIPDISISTQKPQKNLNGNVITFHGNGLFFDDGSDINEILINSSGQILDGTFKVPGADKFEGWYTEPECVNSVDISSVMSGNIDKDIDLWAKDKKTYVMYAGYNSSFNSFIKNPELKHVVFTDVMKPTFTESSGSYEIGGIDSDYDRGIVGWFDNDTKTFFISSQKKGQPVLAVDIPTFRDATTIESVDFENLRISDTATVLYLDDMFFNCKNLTTDGIKNINKIDMTKAESASSMFYGCTSIKEFDFEMLDMSHIINTQQMFRGCTNLKRIYGYAKMPKMAQCGNMFYGCTSLITADFSEFKLSEINIPDSKYGYGCAYYMFCDCNNLEQVDLSGLNMSMIVQFDVMFAGCEKLKYVTFGENFDTSSATDFHRMFENCYSIETIDLSSFNTSKVTGMYDMFQNCYNLKNVNLSSFDTSKVTGFSSMFEECRNLEYLDLSNFDTSSDNVSMYAIFHNSGLKKIKLGAKWKWHGNHQLPKGNWVDSKNNIFTSDGLKCTIPDNISETYELMQNE